MSWRYFCPVGFKGEISEDRLIADLQFMSNGSTHIMDSSPARNEALMLVLPLPYVSWDSSRSQRHHGKLHLPLLRQLLALWYIYYCKGNATCNLHLWWLRLDHVSRLISQYCWSFCRHSYTEMCGDFSLRKQGEYQEQNEGIPQRTREFHVRGIGSPWKFILKEIMGR